jgi:hypothetical protein
MSVFATYWNSYRKIQIGTFKVLGVEYLGKVLFQYLNYPIMGADPLASVSIVA